MSGQDGLAPGRPPRHPGLYAPGRTMSGPVELAKLAMTEGENVLMFKLAGKNPGSSGLGFDLVSVVFERVTNLAAK